MTRLLNSKRSRRVLVVDDDTDQRLRIYSQLELCDYTPLTAEDGLQAKEILDKDPYFDLVLLDYNMPNMDGYEVLNYMKKNEKTKKIPVIMMSGDDETNKISACITLGAKNYLVKPIKYPQVKNLRDYMAEEPPSNNPKDSTQYDTIRELGRGASGTVDLVRNVSTDQLFAMKIIQLGILSPEDKKMALNEITLLQVLKGKNIIKYHEHFTDGDFLYIVMEYAENKSVSDRIDACKKKNEKIPETKIKHWIAQTVFALMTIHEKKILHRDIKTQNMFLTKKDKIKIGDFGIAKDTDYGKTMVGTPYFMSPEVCKGENYGPKADVWALGCAIYEMCLYKKPFVLNSSSSDIQKLFDVIKNSPYEPMPTTVDAGIRKLIDDCLKKDPAARVSLLDMYKNHPFLNQIMNEYADKKPDYKKILDDFILYEKNKEAPSIKAPNPSQDEQKEKEVSVIEWKSKANYYYLDMKVNLKEKLRDIKIGMFKKISEAVTGDEIIEFYTTNHKKIPKDQILAMMKFFVENKYITLANTKEFQDSKDCIINFVTNSDCQNAFCPWFESTTNPIDLVRDCCMLMNKLVKKINSMTEGENNFENNIEFLNFQEKVSELVKVDFDQLKNPADKQAFYLNIYQIMCNHNHIKENSLSCQKKGMLGSLKSSIFGGKQQQFIYNIGGLLLSMEDIKHGILRGNKKSPNGLFKLFGANDPKIKLVLKPDPRLIFALEDAESELSRVFAFDPTTIDSDLERICIEFINQLNSYDSYQNEMILPKFLKDYLADFDNDEEKLLNFVLKYCKDRAIVRERIIEDYRNKELSIVYEEMGSGEKQIIYKILSLWQSIIFQV